MVEYIDNDEDLDITLRCANKMEKAMVRQIFKKLKGKTGKIKKNIMKQ